MEPVYDHAEVRLFHGSALDVLRSLPDESVHACVTSPPYLGLRSYLPDGHPDKALEIGLEGLDAYIARLVEVFAEVRRVLHRSGVLWLNIGDSYNGSGGAGGDYGPGGLKEGQPKYPGRREGGLKSKDLIGVPWRLAFALQDAGWWLRSDIIWHKPQVMPESVTDRPTKSHEYVFLLAKSERYYYDMDAIREPNQPYSVQRPTHNLPATVKIASERNDTERMGRGGRLARIELMNPAGRNRRSVWTIPTGSFDGAHFATFPEALVEPMILAGTSAAGCCPRCLAPYRRVMEKVQAAKAAPRTRTYIPGRSGSGHVKSGCFGDSSAVYEQGGWQAGCSCDAGPAIPCTIIDPFVGSGTAVAVAKRLGRHGIGIDLNAEYLKLAERRLHQDVLPLGVV